MHIKWNRRLDGNPKQRGIIQFRNDILNFFKRSKIVKSSSYNGSSSNSFSRIFRNESSLKRQRDNNKSYVDDSKKVSDCYIGCKLENYHTRLLIKSERTCSVETLDSSRLKNECVSKVLNDVKPNFKSENSLQMVINNRSFCQSDCSISDSLGLSCDDTDTTSDFQSLSPCQEIENFYCAFRKEPRVSETSSLIDNVATRVNCSSQTSRPKFISKVFLVKQVGTLVNLCETRKQEIKRLEAKIRHACLGFDALAICYKYIAQQYDPFSHPLLLNAYEKSKEDLQKATEELVSCQVHLKNLKTIHSQEVRELTKELGNIHSSEIKELKMKHSAELEIADIKHKKEICVLKRKFQQKAEDYKRNQEEIFEKLQENHKKERSELEESYKAQLGAMEKNHHKVKNKLEKELTAWTHEYISLQKQLQIMEEKFMKDKNSIVQRASAKKISLQKEISSLNAVVEIRNGQLRELNNENIKWKEKIEELHIIKGSVNIFKSKEEEHKALLEEKAQLQRMLTLKNEELHNKIIVLSRINNELSMKNEELRYKRQLCIERIGTSSDTPGNQRIKASVNRSNSLNSLPSLILERFSTSADTIAKYGIDGKASMSFSWDSHQSMHKKEGLSKEHFKFDSDKCLQSFCHKPSYGGGQMKKEYSSLLSHSHIFNHSMSMSWGGENFVDYHGSLPNKNFDISPSENWEVRPVNYQFAKPIFATPKEIEFKSNDGNCLPTNQSMDVDKSLSGAISLQSSYNSDSSNSYFATQLESEESSSCSQKSKDSDLKDTCDHVVYDDLDPLGVKHPRSLAGEAMVQEINGMLSISKKVKLVNKDELSQTEENFSSPEESKDKLNTQLSMATPSIDTLSSQGMADSTNLDVSWGDEEILSENDA